LADEFELKKVNLVYGRNIMMTPKEFFGFAKENNAKMVDLKFVDFLGTWQHCSYPTDTWDESTFVDGVGFDGSSIRGWQDIHMSDMLAVPDANTAVLDPFFKEMRIPLCSTRSSKSRQSV
jgi:glutamine synthetase